MRFNQVTRLQCSTAPLNLKLKEIQKENNVKTVAHTFILILDQFKSNNSTLYVLLLITIMVAQMAEQVAHNIKIVGLNPAWLLMRLFFSKLN